MCGRVHVGVCNPPPPQTGTSFVALAPPPTPPVSCTRFELCSPRFAPSLPRSRNVLDGDVQPEPVHGAGGDVAHGCEAHHHRLLAAADPLLGLRQKQHGGVHHHVELRAHRLAVHDVDPVVPVLPELAEREAAEDGAALEVDLRASEAGAKES